MEDLIDAKKKYFSLAAVVDDAINDLDLPVSHYFQKFLKWACNGITQLKLDTAQEVKTILLTVSDTKTCIMPVDMIDWTKIGIPQHQYVITLGVNSDLRKDERVLETLDLGADFPPGWLPNGTDMNPYNGYLFANFQGTNLFGFGGGGGLPQRGHFTIVDRGGGCKELLLDAGITATQIYLEYIALGLNPCGETILSPYIAEYARAYMHHQYEKFKRGPEKSESAIVRTGRDLWHQEMLVRARTHPIDKDTLLATTRKSYRMTNKA